MTLSNLLHWAEENEFEGGFMLSLTLILSNALCIPLSTPLITAAGTIYGIEKGFLLMYSSYNISAVIGFVISRRFLTSLANRYLSRIKTMKGLSRAIETQGWKLVLLLQLPPTGIPTSLLSYAVGATTNLSFYEYFVGCLIGSPFHVFVLVYFGSFLNSIEEIFNGNSDGLGLSLLGLFISMSIAVLTWKLARDEISKVAPYQPMSFVFDGYFPEKTTKTKTTFIDLGKLV